MHPRRKYCGVRQPVDKVSYHQTVGSDLLMPASVNYIAKLSQMVYLDAVSLTDTVRMGFKLVVPTIINHVAVRTQRVYPYAISMTQTIQMYGKTCEKVVYASYKTRQYTVAKML